jgi:hypothetical protein
MVLLLQRRMQRHMRTCNGCQWLANNAMSDGSLKNIQGGFKEMADGRGGRRPGAGRKAGGHNKRTLEFHAEVAKSKRTPLEHMVAVMLDETADQDRRDRMAVAAAPYLHPRLQSIEAKVAETVIVLSEEQRRKRARQAILEAFAERPPLAIVSAADEQANGEAAEEREG